MTESIQILRDQEGTPVVVQMMYDAYGKLVSQGQEGALLREKIRQIATLLESQGVSEVAQVLHDKVDRQQEQDEKRGAHPEVPLPQSEPEPEPEPEPASAKPEPAPAPVPEPAPEPALAPELTSPAGPARDSASVSVGKGYAVPVIPVLLDYFEQVDPSQKAKRQILSSARQLSAISGKRITLSLLKPYICLWDFDEWRAVAFFEITDDGLLMSVDKRIVPEEDEPEIWSPPSGLGKKPLARVKVTAVNDQMLELMNRALELVNRELA